MLYEVITHAGSDIDLGQAPGEMSDQGLDQVYQPVADPAGIHQVPRQGEQGDGQQDEHIQPLEQALGENDQDVVVPGNKDIGERDQPEDENDGDAQEA